MDVGQLEEHEGRRAGGVSPRCGPGGAEREQFGPAADGLGRDAAAAVGLDTEPGHRGERLPGQQLGRLEPQPAVVQLAVAWGQLIGGIALGVGFLTRLAALGIIVIMLGAIATVTARCGRGCSACRRGCGGGPSTRRRRATAGRPPPARTHR